MKRLLSALAVLAALLFAPAARAQIALDLKLGYALPTGNVAAKSTETVYWDKSLSAFVSGAIPIEVAGRYSFTPNFSAGVYFQYGIAFVAASTCTVPFTCSASSIRVGAEAVYGFLPESTFNPWVSLGTGWEWLNQNVTVPGTATVPAVTHSLALNGWEWFNVQIGADWNVSKMFAFGPYVAFFGGQYTSVTFDSVGTTIPSDIRQFHGWWQFGFKGTVNL